MRINKPLTKEQSKMGDLIEPGIYPFEVCDASDEISQKGADMIKLKIRVYLPDGRERIVFDYLMEALEFKFAHFCESTGLWEKYQSGEVSADDCFGRSGEVKIYTQHDKTGLYPPRSSVADYMLSEAQEAVKQERKVAAAKKDDFVDSDLPF